MSTWFQPGLLWAFPPESTGKPMKGTAKGFAKVLISKVIYKWIDCWRSESDCLNLKSCDEDRCMNFTWVICYGMVTVNKQQNLIGHQCDNTSTQKKTDSFYGFKIFFSSSSIILVVLSCIFSCWYSVKMFFWWFKNTNVWIRDYK